jgi:hypothetical protein
MKLEEIQKDQQDGIPWIVKAFENPRSKIPFPGKINLEKHDYLHLVLNRPISSKDEAFVVGFTLGLDEKTRPYHLFIFKFMAKFFYPVKFRMSDEDWLIFKLAFYYARKIRTKNKDKTRNQWEAWKNDLSSTSYQQREQIGINLDELNLFKQVENILFS